MKPFNLPQDQPVDTGTTDVALLEQRCNVLNYITEIGTSLRLYMDTNALVQRISQAVCNALNFRHVALYLYNEGNYTVYATSGVGIEEEDYLRQHPLPEPIMTQLMHPDYRINNSYFIPAEATIWHDEQINNLFVVVEEPGKTEPIEIQPTTSDSAWQSEDLMIVPLFKSDGSLLGFLTPDSPLDDQRPTEETIGLFELFANQAAVAIEGTLLYEEVRRSSEERAVLVEIARALSLPEALRDVETVYRTIYQQVCRIMPVDVFYLTRYQPGQRVFLIDYRVEDGEECSTGEQHGLSMEAMQRFEKPEQDLLFSSAEEYLQYVDDGMPDARAAIVEREMHGKIAQARIFTLIQHGNQSLGFLSVQSYQKNVYTRRQMDLLKEIGGQAAIAITNARLYVAQREALKRAQESEQLKNHFLMTASHELRTPLTAIQGYLELLGEFSEVLDEESKARFIANARRACEELVLLLGNVMDASRLDQDMVALKLGPVNVLQSVQLIVEILEPIISREQRELELAVDENVYVWVDDLRLRQILLNLVGNALKYTPAGTRIEVKASEVSFTELEKRLADTRRRSMLYEGNYALIEICDWGPGVAPPDQARLFTKFMRLDDAINSVQRGAGLGLYLCLQLTEAMSGQIWLESSGIPGEGSTFCVALPLYRE